MKQKYFVDTHKASNALVIVGLMWFYAAWDNTTAWVYLALHGTYGVLWVLKSAFFGDPKWEQPTGIPFALAILGTLSLYWINPWLISSQGIEAPAWYLAACISVYAIGVFFHFAADMQKHVSLQLRPGKLFTDGLWAGCRNPNYFGELLIYSGFCALSMHWAGFCALAAFVAFYWLPNMIKKDRSLSRYPEFAEWKSRSTLFIPRVI